MKKIAILLFYFTFGVLNAQNKNQKLDYIQKNIEPCRISINDSLSIFKIQESLYNNDIKIIVKTENLFSKECNTEIISNELISVLNTSQNPLLKINNKTIERLNIADFKNLIPKKIYAIKKTNYIILIVELYSFSYSTIGNGYIDLFFKIDKKGEVVGRKMLESKTTIKINKARNIF